MVVHRGKAVLFWMWSSPGGRVLKMLRKLHHGSQMLSLCWVHSTCLNTVNKQAFCKHSHTMGHARGSQRKAGPFHGGDTHAPCAGKGTVSSEDPSQVTVHRRGLPSVLATKRNTDLRCCGL